MGSEAQHTPPRTVHVDLQDRSYPIYIGQSLLDRAELFSRHITGSQVLIVTNETVAPLYLDRLVEALADREVATVVVPDGERYKNLDSALAIYDRLLTKGFDRGCTLIALGGGVIGDLAGFAAATYQRGVAFVQAPTTLLALVDSAVGGKTGVNHPRGKNMIGAFHQPRCVVADIDLLTTLPEREYRAGLAEVVKYGIISDYAFFQWLERRTPAVLARETEALLHLVEQCCRNKARTVAADERETGQRALLNLGHTFGHAVETATGYSEWLHGEAVAAGICMAAYLSMREGWITESAFQRIRDLIEVVGLPTRPPPLPAGRFRELMAVDKKSRAGRLRLVLLEGIGNALVTDAFSEQKLEETLRHFGADAAGA